MTIEGVVACDGGGPNHCQRVNPMNSSRSRDSTISPLAIPIAADPLTSLPPSPSAPATLQRERR